MALTVSKLGDKLLAVEKTTILAASQLHVDAAAHTAFTTAVLAHPEVATLVKDTRHSVLYTHPVETLDKAAAPETAKEWITTVYDYSNNQSLRVRSAFPTPAKVTIERTNQQPVPSLTEFQAAVQHLEKDARFGPLLKNKQVTAYRPMPPHATDAEPTGEIQRTLYVGLQPTAGSQATHQIVGVNMITNAVLNFPGGSPAHSGAGPSVCGVPGVNCSTGARGVAGSMWISWPAQNPVWRFLAVRPSASSGVSASGIELRYVDYKGKRLLFQAHVPILNVLYEPGGCGSYRDWQWDEHCFPVDGHDVAPGFRWANTPPKTVCETGLDSGNFSGVAIHDAGESLLLVTVMEAGWYRYIQEWRFHKDGTIQPRFKFGCTSSSCVCHPHIHHVYWRFDFDLNGPANNLVEEFNNPPIFPNTNWHKKLYEIRRNRDFARHRKWRITNTKSNEQYEIVPGASDGIADAYGRGDFWVLRYHGASEIDDGGHAIVPPGTEIDIDKYVNGEAVANQDVVLWYGAHFRHVIDPAHPNEHGCEVVGPDLKLMHW